MTMLTTKDCADKDREDAAILLAWKYNRTQDDPVWLVYGASIPTSKHTYEVLKPKYGIRVVEWMPAVFENKLYHMAVKVERDTEYGTLSDYGAGVYYDKWVAAMFAFRNAVRFSLGEELLNKEKET